ncbi:MAG TPA: hypothetical protein ENK52_06135 [Saprospiraceae bacterium]|nr:hypothetical protein [Saprospiraceae bacterium]
MLKKLKGIFIVEEDDAKKEKASNTKQPEKKTKPTTSPISKNTSSSPTPVSAGTGKVTAKFNDVLLGAMAKNNIDGFDYLEFKESLQSLAKMPMDEKTRYQSAYAMAKTMGATPEYLIKTAKHYINILGKEEQKFHQALANQKTKQIGNKEQQIKQMDLLIKEKMEQINRLTQEIEQHKKLKHKLATEISNSSVKVETTKNNFIASYKNLIAQIQKDMQNIQTYLK